MRVSDERLALMADKGVMPPRQELQAIARELRELRGRMCPQCGHCYHEQACGPTHALIAHERGIAPKEPTP